ncbi:sulfate/thiosulfate ABC transporter inner membrane subunit CysW [Gammaproteobacteria bacterium]
MTKRIQRPLGVGGWLLVGLVVTYLGLVLVLPLMALMAQVLHAGWKPLWRLLEDAGAWQGLRMTLILATIAVLANGVAGIAGALVLSRQRFWGRRLLDALVDLPLAVSPVMTGLAFLLIFGRGGWLAPWLEACGCQVAFAFPGLVVATLFVTFPFTLREVGYVLEELGADEEEAAITLGASAWQTFWRVTLPNVRHGLGYGVLLTMARALGEFGAVLVVGGAISGHTETATTFIYNAVEERQEPMAFGVSLILAAISIGLLAGLEWLKRQRTKM